jgi:hypothetical protein
VLMYKIAGHGQTTPKKIRSGAPLHSTVVTSIIDSYVATWTQTFI